MLLLKKLCLESFRKVAAFPGRVEIFSSHMTVSGKLGIDRTAKSETLDYSRGAKVEVAVKRICDLFLVHLCGSEGINKYGNGTSYADSVSNLDLATLRETCGNNVLCKVSCSVASGTVDLGRAFL